MPNLRKIKCILLKLVFFFLKPILTKGCFTDMLDELQDHVESIDMANGEFFGMALNLILFKSIGTLIICTAEDFLTIIILNLILLKSIVTHE